MKCTFPYLLLLTAFLFFSACKGQNETNAAAEKEVQPDEVPAGKSSSFRLFDESNIPDSFFGELVYEDQLCHWVRRIFQDRSGNLWFGTNHYRVIRYDGQSLDYISGDQGFGGVRVSDIIGDDEGNVWFATSEGLTRYDGNTFANYTVEDGLTNDYVWSLTMDRNGILWIGTMEGIMRYDGESFSGLPLPSVSVKDTAVVLSPNRICSLLEDSEGNIWMGTDGLGLLMYDGREVMHYSKEDGLPDNCITHLLEDSGGNIWIGTMFGGVGLYDGKSFTSVIGNGAVEGEETGSLYEDTDGSIWFSIENYGVYRYRNGAFVNYNEEEGLSTNGVLSMYRDREGRFWFGGWLGLFRYHGDRFEHVGKDNGPWSDHR